MRKLLMSVLGIWAAFVSGAARAADYSTPIVAYDAPKVTYYTPKAPQAQLYAPLSGPRPAWTGFYSGLNVGGGWTANSGGSQFVPYVDPVDPSAVFIYPGPNAASSSGGVVGGGQLGFSYQFAPSIVAGVETDFQGTSISSGQNRAAVATLACPLACNYVLVPLSNGTNPGVHLSWFGSVRGRAGFLVTPTLMLYGAVGFAYGQVQGNSTSFTTTRTGWTAGGGLEWLFLPNWSTKLEYLLVDLSSDGAAGPLGLSSHYRPEVSVVRTGVNYRFNLGAVAPAFAHF
jgi:outer membrane immunogenic protein